MTPTQKARLVTHGVSADTIRAVLVANGVAPARFEPVGVETAAGPVGFLARLPGRERCECEVVAELIAAQAVPPEAAEDEDVPDDDDDENPFG